MGADAVPGLATAVHVAGEERGGARDHGQRLGLTGSGLVEAVPVVGTCCRSLPVKRQVPAGPGLLDLCLDLKRTRGLCGSGYSIVWVVVLCGSWYVW